MSIGQRFHVSRKRYCVYGDVSDASDAACCIIPPYNFVCILYVAVIVQLASLASLASPRYAEDDLSLFTARRQKMFGGCLHYE
jgi:hypothetical protein